MGRIDECLSEYRSWCAKLGIVNVSDINNIIRNGKSSRLINISEIWQEQKLSEIAGRIQNHIDEKKIILISGPSSSGKTTFANKLRLHLKVLGINALSVSMDNYYFRNSEKLPKTDEGKPDFEALEAIDYRRFNSDVKSLMAGEETVLPIYNFDNNPTEERRITLDSEEVIIIEGIHGLNPKITENIPSENKYKIYCSALTALSHDDGMRIKSRTNRLIRRLIRDFYFRNSSCEFTLDMWDDVEEGAKKNIFPYTDSADIIFNSSLLYEEAVYRKHIDNIIRNINRSNKHYEVLMGLRKLVDSFEEIGDELVPGTSIIREFIGGGSL